MKIRDIAVRELFSRLVEKADLPGRLHLAFIYRIATDPRSEIFFSEIFFDEKTNRLPDFFLERIRNVSHAELEAMDTESFWCGILGDCLDREVMSEPWTPEEWAAKQIEFEELRNQILAKAGSCAE
jgi:hypothetical protein